MKSRAMGTSIGTEYSKNKSVNANTQSVPATECRTNNNNNVRIQQGNKVRTTFRSLRDPSSQPLLAQEPSWAKQEANTALPHWAQQVREWNHGVTCVVREEVSRA